MIKHWIRGWFTWTAAITTLLRPCAADDSPAFNAFHWRTAGVAHFGGCAACAHPAPDSDPWLSVQVQGLPLAPLNGQWDPSTAPVIVDALFLYTPEARQAHGNEEDLQRSIRRMIEQANHIFTNSLVGVRLNPVHIGVLSPWTESGNISSEGGRFSTDATVARLREDYKADLLYLIFERDRDDGRGSALIPGSAGDASRAFSVLRRTMISGIPLIADASYLGLAHETGHLLGAGHDADYGFPSPYQTAPSAFPYGNGYRFEAAGITFRDIMAYDPGIPVHYFSTPNLTFAGSALGEPGKSDNVQTMNRLAPLVAKYRSASSRIGFVASNLSVAEGAGSVELGLRREGDLTTSTRVQITIPRSSTAVTNVDYLPPTNRVISFDTGQAEARVVIDLIDDQVAEDTKVLEVRLNNAPANVGLAESSSINITLLDDDVEIRLEPEEFALHEGGAAVEVEVEYLGDLAPGVSKTIAIDGDPTPGAAALGIDYVVKGLPLAFNSNLRRQRISFSAPANEQAEPDGKATLSIGGRPLEVKLIDRDSPGRLMSGGQFNAPVSRIVALPDGGVMAAGDFTELAGQPANRIARLRADGSTDDSFEAPVFLSAPAGWTNVSPPRVNALVPLRDGGWLVAGVMALADDHPVHHLVRLLGDGRVDPTFQTPRFNGVITSLVIDDRDGGIAVAGAFSRVGDQTRRGLVRLKSDGTLDTDYQLNPGLGGRFVVGVSMTLCSQRRLLVGGGFESYNGVRANHLIRLNPDGSLDTSFRILTSGPSGPVYSLAALPDGRAYVGGFFETIGGQNYLGLARLLADGSVDRSFRRASPNGEILAIEPLPNGKVVVGGSFTRIDGVARRFIALLNEDGSVDPSFDVGAGAGDRVWCLAANGLGEVYVGGAFNSFNGLPAARLARLRLPPIEPSFGPVQRNSDGTLETTVFGLPGARYRVETSSDLMTWSSAGELAVTSRTQFPRIALPGSSTAGFLRLARTESARPRNSGTPGDTATD